MLKLIKKISLFIFLMILLVISACANNTEIDETTRKIEQTESEMVTNTTSTALSSTTSPETEQKTKTFEYLLEGEETDKIEQRYFEELSEAVSSLEYCNITSKYVKEYKNIIDQCYNNILENCTEETKQKIIYSQEKWQDYYDIETEAYTSYIYEIYGDGSIVPIFLATHDYSLYRDRAIQLELLSKAK